MADGATGSTADAATEPEPARPGTILQSGRAKAYRPLPPEVRAAAYANGLAAYDRGDFFEAHEILEPAWMGTADIGERELYQGLIKVAAGFVHGVRGNPPGIARNLEGARTRLVAARDAGFDGGLDLDDLIGAVDDRLTRLAAGETQIDPPVLRRKRP
jgi:predicted metal-dependent hydrolase